jgi:hypothetical protein
MKELVELLIDAYDTPEKPYDWKAGGYLVLIEEGDVDRVLHELPEVNCDLLSVYWEGASWWHGFYYAIFLRDNEFGIGFLLPNAPWVKGRLRELLDEMIEY